MYACFQQLGMKVRLRPILTYGNDDEYEYEDEDEDENENKNDNIVGDGLHDLRIFQGTDEGSGDTRRVSVMKPLY